MRYLDEFVRCRCAADMLALKLFPNAKKITESFGAYSAVRAHLGLDFADPSIAVLCVGDGVSPRTAATFAYRSAWMCLSVDPRMRLKWLGANPHGITRLFAIRDTIVSPGGVGWQNRRIIPIRYHKERYRQVVVVAVHSHASLAGSVEAAYALAPSVSAISIPCCFKDDLDGADVVYEDRGILSPHRTVYVWKDLGKERTNA